MATPTGRVAGLANRCGPFQTRQAQAINKRRRDDRRRQAVAALPKPGRQALVRAAPAVRRQCFIFRNSPKLLTPFRSTAPSRTPRQALDAACTKAPKRPKTTCAKWFPGWVEFQSKTPAATPSGECAAARALTFDRRQKRKFSAVANKHVTGASKICYDSRDSRIARERCASVGGLWNREALVTAIEHDPEKWRPVFRKDHAQT